MPKSSELQWTFGVPEEAVIVLCYGGARVKNQGYPQDVTRLGNSPIEIFVQLS